MSHKWRFCRMGGFTQVRLETGADLLALDELDLKLWVALSCPTKGLEIDPRTLELLDTDKEGRVRAGEIIEAVKWAGTLVKGADELTRSASALPLSAINDQTPEGRLVLASARQVLAALGKADAQAITVEDAADVGRILSQTTLNGDGIVCAEAADDETTRSVINDIIACLGAETDRCGKPGVSQPKVDRFFAEAQAYSDWWAKAEKDRADILPLGDATAAAAAVFRAV
jgi:hypothetical protein